MCSGHGSISRAKRPEGVDLPKPFLQAVLEQTLLLVSLAQLSDERAFNDAGLRREKQDPTRDGYVLEKGLRREEESRG